MLFIWIIYLSTPSVGLIIHNSKRGTSWPIHKGTFVYPWLPNYMLLSSSDVKRTTGNQGGNRHNLPACGVAPPAIRPDHRRGSFLRRCALVTDWASHSSVFSWSGIDCEHAVDIALVPDWKSISRRTPLAWAAKNGHTGLVTLLRCYLHIERSIQMRKISLAVHHCN